MGGIHAQVAERYAAEEDARRRWLEQECRVRARCFHCGAHLRDEGPTYSAVCGRYPCRMGAAGRAGPAAVARLRSANAAGRRAYLQHKAARE